MTRPRWQLERAKNKPKPMPKGTVEKWREIGKRDIAARVVDVDPMRAELTCSCGRTRLWIGGQPKPPCACEGGA